MTSVAPCSRTIASFLPLHTPTMLWASIPFASWMRSKHNAMVVTPKYNTCNAARPQPPLAPITRILPPADNFPETRSCQNLLFSVNVFTVVSETLQWCDVGYWKGRSFNKGQFRRFLCNFGRVRHGNLTQTALQYLFLVNLISPTLTSLWQIRKFRRLSEDFPL